MIVHVVAVGRVRDPAWRAAGDEYVRRARRTLRIEIREVPEAGRQASGADARRRVEGERLTRALPAGARLVALTRGGDALDSDRLAALVQRWREDARDVAILIGGADGLADDLLARAERRLSLSALTLPHELARLVLLEQLYRAVTILRGEPYHRGRAR